MAREILLNNSADNILQEQVEQEISGVENSLEAALKQLWERAYAAANCISTLREENTVLQLRIAELESALSQRQADLTSKNGEMEGLRKELDGVILASASNGLLDKEERLRLQERIRIILEKINSHL